MIRDGEGVSHPGGAEPMAVFARVRLSLETGLHRKTHRVNTSTGLTRFLIILKSRGSEGGFLQLIMLLHRSGDAPSVPSLAVVGDTVSLFRVDRETAVRYRGATGHSFEPFRGVETEQYTVSSLNCRDWER